MAQIQYLSHFFSGLDGSRTRVRNTIPCPSTSVVYSLTFPPRPGNKHPEHFSSFMLRPYAQSFAYVVSHMFEAGILRCECPRATAAIRQRMLNYLQRYHATRFSSCKTPVETFTTPYSVVRPSILDGTHTVKHLR